MNVQATGTRVFDRPRPDDAALIGLLARAYDGRPIELLQREPIGSGTLPKEVVRFRSAGRSHAVVCKYSAHRGLAFGHRPGTRHEARVYRDILDAGAATTPRFIAAGQDPSGTDWLMIEFVQDASRLSDAYSRLPDAARWLASFHRAHAGLTDDPRLAFLTPYDRAYFEGWVDRTVSFNRDRLQEVPWLPALAERFRADLPILQGAEATVVHGEFTIHNVMVAERGVFPLDWESAAIGPGEIDLACLIDRWDPETVEQCITAYVDVRWDSVAPAEFEARLAMAELYLHFRWLGEDSALMFGKKRVWRFERLRTLAESLRVTA